MFEAIPVNERQLESVLAVAQRMPGLAVVLNHMGNPPMPGSRGQARSHAAAALPNMSVKLSAGLALVMTWRWSTEAVRRYSDHVLDRFGPTG